MGFSLSPSLSVLPLLALRVFGELGENLEMFFWSTWGGGYRWKDRSREEKGPRKPELAPGLASGSERSLRAVRTLSCRVPLGGRKVSGELGGTPSP